MQHAAHSLWHDSTVDIHLSNAENEIMDAFCIHSLWHDSTVDIHLSNAENEIMDAFCNTQSVTWVYSTYSAE